MKRLASEIYSAVKSGKLYEPFKATDLRSACPGWAFSSYGTFPWKHRIGNGKTTELFEQIGPGLYRTIPKLY